MRRQIEARPVQPIVLNRLSVARLASIIGGVAFLVVILGFMAQRDLTPLTIVGTLVGIIGITVWTLLAPDDLRNLISGRQARYGSNSVFAVILAIATVTLLYSFINSTNAVADMTSIGLYTIKANLQPVMNQIGDKKIVITAFYSTSRLNDQSQDAAVLQMFADAKPNIKVKIVDPNEDPATAQAFGMTNNFSIYVSLQNADGTPDVKNSVHMSCPDNDYNSATCYANERWIGEAIAQLLARNKFKVLFSTGHGELSTDEASKGDSYLIRTELTDVGIVTGELDLRSQPIPADTSVLVLLSPQADFSQDEVNKIGAYLTGGGKLILMTKPPYVSAYHFMMTNDSPMRNYIGTYWGLQPQPALVYDPASYIGDWYAVQPAHTATNSKITVNPPSSYVKPVFKLANPWAIARNVPANVVITPLFTTSDKSYAKTDLAKVAANPNPAQLPPEPGDVNGSMVLAASAENTQTGAKIIVLGDSFWTINEVVSSFDGNELWRNLIDYTTSYLTQVTVDPKVASTPLITTSDTLNRILWGTLVFLPGAVLASGAVVMWNRMRR
jgi:ABC-2 type transport system permease protein